MFARCYIMRNEGLQRFYHHLIEEGIAPSTRRAHRRDEAYFWQWALMHFGIAKHYPIERKILIEFILMHLQGGEGKALRVTTLRRYLASLSSEHNKRGVDNTCRHEQIKLLLRRARVAQATRPAKKQAITQSLLTQLISSCDDSLKGIRDKAILLVSFASGGRRRSELSNFLIEDIKSTHNGYQLLIRKSKTDQSAKGKVVPVTGEAADAISQWLNVIGESEGYLFRSIDRHNNIGAKISGHSINALVKARITMIGLDHSPYGSHSLRAGFMTEACNQGIALPVAMALSGHSSMEVAASYYRESEVHQNPAAYLLGRDKH